MRYLLQLLSVGSACRQAPSFTLLLLAQQATILLPTHVLLMCVFTSVQMEVKVVQLDLASMV